MEVKIVELIDGTCGVIRQKTGAEIVVRIGDTLAASSTSAPWAAASPSHVVAPLCRSSGKRVNDETPTVKGPIAESIDRVVAVRDERRKRDGLISSLNRLATKRAGSLF